MYAYVYMHVYIGLGRLYMELIPATISVNVNWDFSENGVARILRHPQNKTNHTDGLHYPYF